MRVLLIDADADYVTLLGIIFDAESIVFDHADDLDEGVSIARFGEYDVILLGLDMKAGLEAVRRIRAAKITTPLICYSGSAGVAERVRALDLGADDVLNRPVHRDEMISRLRAMTRRARGVASPVIESADGALVVDTNAKQAFVDGVTAKLTGSEWRILELLALRKGAVVTKEMILSHLYGGMDEPEIKIVEVFICKLRAKLKAAAGDDRQFVTTVWGRGYAFGDPRALDVGAGLGEDEHAARGGQFGLVTHQARSFRPAAA